MKYILFDLDGTLLDSQCGITRCLNHALAQFGQEPRTDEQLAEFIGPPLEVGFGQLLQTDDEALITEAVAAYRSRYRDIGILESQLYDGIPQLLASLDREEHALFIATSKPQPFAERLAAHFSIEHHFVSVNGTTFDKTRLDKVDVLRHTVAVEKIEPSQAVMIGDRKHDILAAQEHGMATIGVLWGYGNEQELAACKADQTVSTVAELSELLDAG